MRALVAAAIVALSLPAHARESLAEVRAAIEAGNRTLCEAIARQNAEQAASVYLPDATIYPSGAPTVTGRKAIGDFLAGVGDLGVAELVLDTVDVDFKKTLAVESGTWKTKGPDTKVLSRGRYLVVWKKVDGAWRIWRDIWNEDPRP